MSSGWGRGSGPVYAGEVVGMAGLIGSGRTEIAKVIFGASKRNLINGGVIKLDGKPVRFRVPKQAINAGISYITEDRKLNGFFETMRIDDNIYIGKLATKAGWRLFLSRLMRNKLAGYWVERLKIAALQRKARIVELSGGNQQKVGHRQVAGSGPADRHLRRADAWRRRRHHPRDPRPDPATRRRGQCHRRHLLVPPRNPRRVRPYPGRAPRPHRRRVRRRDCDAIH
jgi:ABC transporter